MVAYQGAEMLIGQAASADVALYNKLRAAMLARMQDNQLFSAISFLVGHNDLGRARREAFVGKSAILAPQDLTPRFSGVLVEMGNQRSEGVLTAEWDFAALRSLWETSDTPVRSELPLGQVSEVLAQLYARLQSLPPDEPAGALTSAPAANVQGATGQSTLVKEPIMTLDDLPIFASITRRWPLTEDPAMRLPRSMCAFPLAARWQTPSLSILRFAPKMKPMKWMRSPSRQTIISLYRVFFRYLLGPVDTSKTIDFTSATSPARAPTSLPTGYSAARAGDITTKCQRR